MRFEFSCTCGQIYRVEYRFAGCKTKCQACGEIIGIPMVSLTMESSTRPAVPSSAPISRAPQRPAPPAREPLPGLKPSDASDASTIESRFDLPVRAAQPRKRLPARVRVSQPEEPVQESPGLPLPILTQNSSARNTKSQGLPKWAMVSIVAIATAAVGGIGLAVSSAFKEEEEPAGPVAKQYAPITHEIGNFSIEHPTDWVSKSGGGTNGVPPWVSFEGNEAHVRVRGDAGAVVVGSMADAGADIGLSIPANELAAGAQQLAPVVVVHEHEKDAVKGDYLDFQESTPEIINAEGFGEGRMSTFSGKSGFTRYKGLRCTFLASDWQYNIVCTIPEKKFDRYEPVFRKMIATFKR